MAQEDRPEYISLPYTYPIWREMEKDLLPLENREVQGLKSLETLLKKHDRWGNISTPLKLLNDLLETDSHFTQQYFSDTLLPWIAMKGLQVYELFEDLEFKVLNLHKGKSGEVEVNRLQAASLVALAFLNAYEPVGSTYQHLTLANWLCFPSCKSQIGKLKCLLYYFERIIEAEKALDGDFLMMNITVSRRSNKPGVDGDSWKECEKKLCPFDSLGEGMIESADGCLQVDFANAFIGGGVLNMGNVQEEIRFVINPECLISLLFCEEMDEGESILIVGAEQFTSYSGYGGNFECLGPYKDTNPIDDRQRRCVSIVAMDATCFSSGGHIEQYRKQCILRELNKAYCGFGHAIPSDNTEASKLAPVSTGNWGCGMFGGEKMLKTIIQWMAASRVGRDVKYFTFNDEELASKQKDMVKALLEKDVTVGQLYRLLTEISELAETGKPIEFDDLFSYLVDRVKSS